MKWAVKKVKAMNTTDEGNATYAFFIAPNDKDPTDYKMAVEESEGIRCLITSAPDLLDATKLARARLAAILEVLPASEQDHADVLGDLDAAIGKAIGQSG